MGGDARRRLGLALALATSVVDIAQAQAYQASFAAIPPPPGTVLAPDTVVPTSVKAALPRRPATAMWYSLGFTVGPVVAGALLGNSTLGATLVVTGLVFGPATGFWYGHVSGKSWPGAGIRAVGLTIAAAGFGSCALGSLDNSFCKGGELVAIYGGLGLLLGSAIYDIASVSDKVRAHNASLSRAAIVPLFSPSARRVGVEVAITF